MSTRLFHILIAITAILGAIVLSVSFSINPAPPAGATIAQVEAWGKAHETLILAGAWLQAIGSLLEVIFILGIIVIAGATQRLAGWITAFAATVIMTVSMVEVSFYISAVQSGVSGNLNGLSISLTLIQAIQHAYVIVPAPAMLIGLGIVILESRVLPRIFGYLGLAFGVVLGVLGFVGTFTSLQQVIDYVLTAQEVWFVAAGIALIVITGKVRSSAVASEVS
ncbi:MAG: hypothetical protein ACJ788_23430 [Ktedonobacteraceae bacterium]